MSIIKLLLKHKVSLTHRSRHGTSHLAQADINAVNLNGNAALHFAYAYKCNSNPCFASESFLPIARRLGHLIGQVTFHQVSEDRGLFGCSRRRRIRRELQVRGI